MCLCVCVCGGGGVEKETRAEAFIKKVSKDTEHCAVLKRARVVCVGVYVSVCARACVHVRACVRREGDGQTERRQTAKQKESDSVLSR